MHHLENWVRGAERVADGVLAAGARVLEEREREGVRRGGDGDGDGDGKEVEGGKERVVGTTEVLRGLSRVIDR